MTGPLPEFDTHPRDPVATLEPAVRDGGPAWFLRAGYEYGELLIWGTEWPGYRAADAEAAQAAADAELAARRWTRTGPWQHGTLLDLGTGGRDEVWQATVRDRYEPAP